MNSATILKTEPEDTGYLDYYHGSSGRDNEDEEYYENPTEAGCPDEAAAESLLSGTCNFLGKLEFFSVMMSNFCNTESI